jgi:D-3-phosphoglycerate dehydrogenase
VVGTPSTGVNHMDTDYLKNNNIKYFCLLDDREGLESITASAEFTWLHIMNSLRKFSQSLTHVNNWRESNNESLLRSNELSGKKLGVIGFGRIGRKLKKYADAFDVDFKFYDPYVEGGCTDISELYNSDVLSINCYLTTETTNLITEGFLDNFKKPLIVVNTSRGEVVDENYVAGLIKSQDIFYSCDVLCNEQDINQLKEKSPLLQMNLDYDNLIITPHVAGCTIESQEKALKTILKLCMK